MLLATVGYDAERIASLQALLAAYNLLATQHRAALKAAERATAARDGAVNEVRLVLRQLKADVRTKTIPIVVMTTSSQEHDVEESYRLGVNSYVQKPVDFAKFIDVVRELGRYWLSFNRAPYGAR